VANFEALVQQKLLNFKQLTQLQSKFDVEAIKIITKYKLSIIRIVITVTLQPNSNRFFHMIAPS